jgi:hypothetical protein
MNLYLSILLHYYTLYTIILLPHNSPRKTYLHALFSQHVSALAGHHQVFLLMVKLLNCTEYHFLTSHVP